jgi:hypothetical protein
VNSQDETYDDETVKRAKISTTNYLKSNFENIQSVEITKVYQNEMGGMTVEGKVNNGDGEFSTGIEKDFSVGNVGVNEKFPNRKEECAKNTCEYEY